MYFEEWTSVKTGYEEMSSNALCDCNCDGIKTRLQEIKLQITTQSSQYSLLKRLFLALAVVNITLIICVSVVMSLKMASCTHSSCNGFTAPLPDDTTLNKTIMDTVFCVSCFDLTNLVGQVRWEHVSNSKTRCCFKDVLAFLSTIMTAVKEKRKHLFDRIHRLEERVGNHYRSGTLNSNGISKDEGISNEQQPTNDLTTETINMINKWFTTKRSIIHLKNEKGGFRKDGSWCHIKWSFDYEKEGSLSLSSDSTHIEVNKSGHYFLYSRVRFNRTSSVSETRNVTLRFYITKSKHGTMADIEEVSLRCIFSTGTFEHESTLQTIVLLTKNDRISVSIPWSQHKFLSREGGVHSLGLFEL